MNRRKIKECLRSGMEEEFKGLKGYKSDKKKGEIIMKSNFRKRMMPVMAVVATSFCLLLGVVIFSNNKSETLVALDVNPAVEMELNNKEKVIKIEAKNEDAKKILGEMKLKNVDANVAVNAIVGSMFKNGYLKENSNDNDILLTVSNEDEIKSKDIKEKLTQTLKQTLSENNSKAEILLQEDKITDEDFDFANEYDISVGRAKFIKKLLEKTPDLSQEQLSQMTIKELVEYLNDKNIDYDDIIETDDDREDDLLDKKEDEEDKIKDAKEKEAEKREEEREKAQERKEKEAEKREEEKERAQERKEKEAEKREEEREKAQERKEKEAEKREEERERAQERKEKEAEKREEEREKAQERKEKEAEKSEKDLDD